MDKVDSIPEDYDGVMGVPITFLDKFNPDQFEIIGMGSDVPKTLEHVAYKKENKIVYEKMVKYIGKQNIQFKNVN